MEEWKLPPKIKVIEALSAVADNRVVNDDLLKNEGKCFSVSTPGKTYTILYDEKNNTISSNDSGSVNQSFLGYPAIAFLLKIGKIKFDESILEMVENIDWIKIKGLVHKDYESSYRLILGNLYMEGFDVNYFVSQIENICSQILELHLSIMQK